MQRLVIWLESGTRELLLLCVVSLAAFCWRVRCPVAVLCVVQTFIGLCLQTGSQRTHQNGMTAQLEKAHSRKVDLQKWVLSKEHSARDWRKRKTGKKKKEKKKKEERKKERKKERKNQNQKEENRITLLLTVIRTCIGKVVVRVVV